MRVVVTGQVGLDKQSFLARVAEMAGERGESVRVFHVGDMMYREAPDVGRGRILDLPLGRLTNLRRSVFKDILSECEKPACRHAVINTHATFRWKHGLFCAFDYDQMSRFDADLYITLVDNVDRVHSRLVRDGHNDHTLKDIMVWREEEIMATELLSQIVRGHGRSYILARGADGDDCAADVLARMMLAPGMKKAYLSFPMSHVQGSTALLAEIEAFRRRMKKYFVCFDPGDVEEKHLCKLALQAAQEGHRSIEVGGGSWRSVMETAQVLDIIADIDGQIYARDFKLIDQADMIVSLVPTLADGRPGLSSGVERELQHAHEATRDVFVIWTPSVEPSPFITETASRVFRTVDEAERFFVEHGYISSARGTLFE